MCRAFCFRRLCILPNFTSNKINSIMVKNQNTGDKNGKEFKRIYAFTA